MTEPPAARVPARSTALGAATLFLPLAAVLIWWTLQHRLDPGLAPRPGLGTLPPFAGLAAAILAAAGPSVLAALFLANRRRLLAVLRVTRQKAGGAMILALLTPVATLQWWPLTAGLFLTLGLVRGPAATLITVPAIYALLTLAWFVPVALILSGIRHAGLRAAVFALVWWSGYGIVLLRDGYHDFAF